MSVIRRSFGINLWVMEILGLYPSENSTHGYKLRAYTIYAICLIPTAVCGVLGFFLNEDLKISDYNSFINVGMVMYIFKFMPFVKNGHDIKKCVECLNSNSFKVTQDSLRRITENCIYVCQRNSLIFFFGMIMGWLSWCAKPLLWGANYQLPLNIWIPFERKGKPMVYTCVYLFLATGVGYAGIACGAVDPLIWGLACHITSQLKILKKTLQQLDQFAEIGFTHTFNNRNKSVKFSRIYCQICLSAIHYQEISDFVNKYETSFSQVVFSQLTGSILVIGLCCLQVTKIPLYDFNSIMMISYLCFILLQIYFSCYYGTTLLEENATLCNAICMGKWYNYDKKSKKALSVLMQRSSYPMIVRVGKIVELSLDTFTMIIKRSYSLLAVLQNFE